MPASQAYSDEEMLEEERRLLYVAVTRAKEFLYLCCPKRIYDRRTGSRYTPLSLFLRELQPGSYYQNAVELKAVGGSTPGADLHEEAKFNLGDAVRHPFFGRGRVIAVPDNLKVRIQFEDGHTRLLHLGYAPLERASLR